MFRYLLARLREPSTLAGLGVLAGLAGMPPETVSLAAQIVAGLAGVAAVMLPERQGEA